KDKLQKASSHLYQQFKQDPLRDILILQLSGYNSNIPTTEPYVRSVLILLCSPALLVQTYVLRNNRFRTIATVLAAVISIIAYAVAVTMDNTGVSALCLNLAALWLFVTVLRYLTLDATNNPTSAFYGRFLQFIKAGAVAILINTLLSVILLFVALIFPENLPVTFITGHLIPTLWTLVFFIVLFSYESVPSEPGKLYTFIFKTVVPKFTVFSGTLAVIYLFLILIDVRPDARFLYTYYPYITLYYLFFLAGFRIKATIPERPLILILFSALTALCLILTVKRVYADSSLILGAVYIILFNGAFLVHNLYLLIRKAGPGAHTKLLALVMGLIMFMPLVGYTSFIRFVTYTHEGDTYIPHFSISSQFDKDAESAQSESDTAGHSPAGNQKGKVTNLTPRRESAISYHIASYAEANLNNVFFFNKQTRKASRTFGDNTLALDESGKNLTVTLPDGQLQTYNIPKAIEEQIPAGDENTAVTLNTDNYLIVITQYHNDNTSTSLTFDIFYK
ncbi:MAG: hypothetical protein KHW39_06680, partial [Megasphaera micronuciformis]|nr:hypothetical protein [Megasphaera micronuciformis]